MKSWMLYGAYGYTGKLVLEEALRKGLKPVLSGRSRDKLLPLAQKYGLEARVVDLENPVSLRKALEDMDLVFHSAGPFIFTSAPMISACIDTKTHYVDITGEIPVFENTLRHHRLALEKGITLMSGVGFDVVPTDCLALHVSNKLPGATHLEIALASQGSASAGTMKTSVEFIPQGSRVRRDGQIVPYPMGQGARKIPFSCGKLLALPMPWGDVSTAFHTTGIPNITVYMSFPPTVVSFLRLFSPFLRSLLSIESLRRRLQKKIETQVQGPSEERRKKTRCYIWARACDGHGRQISAWLETMEGYTGTAIWGVEAVRKILFENIPAGALTPAKAFGEDFVLVDGVRRWS